MLKRTTSADRDLTEVPRLAPHLEFRPIGDEQTLLVSEAFNTLLRGQIHCDLMPLLDGRRTHEEIAAALAPAHSASEVRTAIAALASRGYLVSGDYGMPSGRAAYWSSLGASPRWAEQRLEGTTVAVTGDAGLLARRLEALGVRAGTVRPSLSAIVCTDYLDARHDGINRRHLGSGAPWILVRPGSMRPLFGPVFRPAAGGPCWACLAYRMEAHEEVHSFLRNVGGESSTARPRAAEPTLLEAVCGLAAAEIARWLVLGELAPIHERAISLDLINLENRLHPAMRRPQCLACGDEALYRPDRPAEPVQLRSSPKPVHNSGGQRTVPPAVTLARYRHLVSPITGVVTWLTRTTDEADPWLHVYWAGNNYALRSRRLSSLRRSLRSKSAGKGSTPRQSEVSALCEAIERYSGAFHGDEIRCRRRLVDFENAGESEAIHPNDVQLFSDRQLDDAERINALGHPYNFVPPRLDPEAEIDWSPVWSLTQGRHRRAPTSILYGMAGEVGDGSGFKADSNGCAAGNTLEEAILQGFLELVERDAFAVWWYNRLHVPEVDLSSFGDEYLASARDYYGRHEREMWVLDATADLGIPVFVAISRRTGEGAEDILYGAGAHTDPHIAALRAVCELNQCLQWVQGSARRESGYTVNDPVSRWWWRNGRVADHPWLAPAPGMARRGKPDYPVPDTTDTRDDVEHCRALVEARGMEFLVLDQTRPDIGMPVARVIVPGMRHFWARFAPGRLFDVPVSMGLRESPLPEDQLNPIPVIA
ncbi:TOMM precursor leader peptide-binding protein [Candidatus Palauibacter sp.]|uniref:TOMM precursor leader peptide-binding protein n=1 Tax=Candidatus Palauibacter sp. TaxID=3101350 RepID=UPI003B51F63C